jgi:hypothetical protein
LSELSQTIGHSVSSWAAVATKGTNLPQPSVLSAPPSQHKTLAHALSRAAGHGAITLKDAQQSDALAGALQSYAVAQDSVGAARLAQDAEIARDCNAIWQATLTQINAANKARVRAVLNARFWLIAYVGQRQERQVRTLRCRNFGM